MGRIEGCCSRASAFAPGRKRASRPGVHAIWGWSTLHASRRSRSLSHNSYTSATPPRPTRRRTSYLDPSARARRCAVGTPASPAAGTAAAARSFVMTVGDGVPQAGQNAEPDGISARHEGQVSWVVTAPKICIPSSPCQITYSDALPPDRARARAGVCRARDSGVALPGAARLSGAARSAPGPATRRGRERRDGRGDDGGWDEIGGVVLETRPYQPPPTPSNLPNF